MSSDMSWEIYTMDMNLIDMKDMNIRTRLIMHNWNLQITQWMDNETILSSLNHSMNSDYAFPGILYVTEIMNRVVCKIPIALFRLIAKLEIPRICSP